MIQSFASRDTEHLFHGHSVARFRSFERAARKKLQMVHAAQHVNDLLIFPGNHLKVLQGNRAGQYSIRINAQWRICFRWNGVDALDVEIVDYH
nr:type II toxin-antitoxin system RelE/ParE family toxin [uncultured Duganella sp.]